MKNNMLRFWLFVLLAACCRAIQVTGVDLWHGETLWLTRSALDLSGSPLFCVLLDLWSSVSLDETWLRTLPFLLALAAAGMLHLLARTAFDGNGLLETGTLVAISPLLCSTAWEVHPAGLEIFAAAFWLHAFFKLSGSAGWGGIVRLSLATALAVTANPLLALLAPGQVVTLLLFRRREKGVAFRWAVGFAIGVALVATVVLPSRIGDEAPPPEPPQRALTGYDVGYLVTDLGLGRLYPWAPVTPILTFKPPGFEDPDRQSHAIGSPDEDGGAWFWQGMQLLLLGCFSATLILACLSVWRIRTRPLPGYLKSGIMKKIPSDPGREGATLLLLSLLVPVAWCLTLAREMDAPFPERRLVFLAVPFLLLVGRGLVGLQWAAARIFLVGVIALLSLAYTFCSSEIKVAASGIGAAAREVQGGWVDGDAVVTDRFTAGPFRWYAGLDEGELERSAADGGRLWVVRFDPDEGSGSAGLDLFLAASGLGGGGAGMEKPFVDAHPGAVVVATRPAEAYSLHLWKPGSP